MLRNYLCVIRRPARVARCRCRRSARLPAGCDRDRARPARTEATANRCLRRPGTSPPGPRSPRPPAARPHQEPPHGVPRTRVQRWRRANVVRQAPVPRRAEIPQTRLATSLVPYAKSASGDMRPHPPNVHSWLPKGAKSRRPNARTKSVRLKAGSRRAVRFPHARGRACHDWRKPAHRARRTPDGPEDLQHFDRRP